MIQLQNHLSNHLENEIYHTKVINHLIEEENQILEEIKRLLKK